MWHGSLVLMLSFGPVFLQPHVACISGPWDGPTPVRRDGPCRGLMVAGSVCLPNWDLPHHMQAGITAWEASATAAAGEMPAARVPGCKPASVLGYGSLALQALCCSAADLGSVEVREVKQTMRQSQDKTRIASS